MQSKARRAPIRSPWQQPLCSPKLGEVLAHLHKAVGIAKVHAIEPRKNVITAIVATMAAVIAVAAVVPTTVAA